MSLCWSEGAQSRLIPSVQCLVLSQISGRANLNSKKSGQVRDGVRPLCICLPLHVLQRSSTTGVCRHGKAADACCQAVAALLLLPLFRLALPAVS